MRLQFTQEDPGFWQAKHNGRYGMVLAWPDKVVWAVAGHPSHTAQWHWAKTVLGAKRACGKALRSTDGSP